MIRNFQVSITVLNGESGNS